MTYQKTIQLSDLIIPKYYDTFNDTHYMHKIFTSGRAGTKSSRGAIKAVFEIVNNDECSVVIMRKFHNKLSKTVYKEVLRAINRLGLKKSLFKITKSPMEIKYLKNGNTIYFTGNDSIDDTKGMIDENKPIKLVIVDEVNEFFEKGEGEDELVNIEATFVRGNDEEFCMEYYFNPPRNDKAPVMQWVHKMEQRNDCIHVHTDYRDVPEQWLGKKLIASAKEMLMSDGKMYKWLWLGLCTGLDELIYYMFDEEKHVKEPTEQQYKNMQFLGIGIDYGQMNPTTYECFGLDFHDKCIRGIDEYYHCGREEGQKTPSEYAQDFKAFKERVETETKKKVLYVYIDPSAKGLAEEIKRVCPDIAIKDANNTVLLGINRQQKLMALRRLFISPRQKHLINEMHLYEWDKDLLDKGREQPVKTNDHCQDATRYLIMGFWRFIRQLLPMLGDD